MAAAVCTADAVVVAVDAVVVVLDKHSQKPVTEPGAVDEYAEGLADVVICSLVVVYPAALVVAVVELGFDNVFYIAEVAVVGVVVAV